MLYIGTMEKVEPTPSVCQIVLEGGGERVTYD